MTNKSDQGECEACPNVGSRAEINKMMLCEACFTKEVLTAGSVSSKEVKEIEVTPSTTPIDVRLRKAFIDKTNSILTSDMDAAQLKYHIADLEDMVKVLNVQIQAALDVDEQWARDLTNEEREALRTKDKAYRSKARPAMNADGSIKVKPVAKPGVIGDAGNKAFERLVEKLTRTGMSRDKAEQMIRGMKK